MLAAGTTHVWRVPLNPLNQAEHYSRVLSDDERERVSRFYFPHHAKRYAVAHTALREILAAYEDVDPKALQFTTGEHGKPEFANGGVINPTNLHFNLSHSGDLALIAVARSGAVGVDVEQWRTNVQHLEIAERFFSPHEQASLRALSGNEAILRGFFSMWSRKEAYLKATGHGIARGLHHFDVSMDSAADAVPGLPINRSHVVAAQLLADRLDPAAIRRWAMSHIFVGEGYSAALVSTRAADGAEGAVVLFESPYI